MVQRRRPFGWKHSKATLSCGKSVQGLEEEKEEKVDMEIVNGFHLHSSPIFLLFLIFYGCTSPLHALISFSSVSM